MTKRERQIKRLRAEVDRIGMDITDAELQLDTLKRNRRRVLTEIFVLETGLKVGKKVMVNGTPGRIVDHAQGEAPYAIFSPFLQGDAKRGEVSQKRIPVYKPML